MTRALALLSNFKAFSLSIASHALADLAEFPDSRTFYAEIAANGNTALPAEIKGLLYMATCNRIEVYAEFADGISASEGIVHLNALSPVFARITQGQPQIFSGEKMLEHLIAVASGLKSLALGETQIAGQIKRDMANAQAAGWLSPAMTTVMKKALETQKKIRNSTGISENSYSLMSLVEDAVTERGLRGMEKGIILVGASEMSAKVARYALRRNLRNFLLVRKDRSRPMNADMREILDTHPGNFTEITLRELQLGKFEFAADAIVLASSADEPLLSAAQITHLTHSGLLAENTAIIDLSLPANVDSDAAEKFSARLISLASLQKLSEAAKADRLASAAAAEPIIRRALYQLWLDLLYRENPVVVRGYLDEKTAQSEAEWSRLAQEAALSEKQKRIMYDFLKKEQRRALASHREMILDLIAGVAVETPA